MILYYIYNILKFKKWRILLFIGSCILLLQIYVNIQNLSHLIDLHKCPACYGVSACHDIHKVNILWNVHTLLSFLFGVKNVFFGTYNGNQIVLKKLAHISELKTLDIAFCNILNLQYPCIPNISTEILKKHAASFKEHIKKAITSEFSDDDSSRLRLCPTTQHLDDLFYNIYLKNNQTDPTEHLINLWALLFINPEPLMLQILPAEDGWPVPKYFGACGQIIMQEYIGLPLVAYYEKPWIQRIKIASSLLNAAYMFTFYDKFSFYLTDVSADNIAVDHNNVAKFIDLENIIVVDRNTFVKDRSVKWQELHENMMHLECPNCFAFSSEDICNHHLSDHNYYAICKLLLNSDNESFYGSFLHDIPVEIQQEHPDIEHLLQQCAIPDSTNTRIVAGQQLKALLDTILQKIS